VLVAALGACTTDDPSSTPTSTAPSASTTAGLGATTDPSAEPSSEPSEPGPAPSGDPADPAGVPVLVAASLESDGVELSGYVQGVIVDDGSCRYELTGPGGTTSVTTRSLADASVTTCPWGTISSAGLASGTYEARLVWESETSEPLTVTIP
jgi:hypothetical protein